MNEAVENTVDDSFTTESDNIPQIDGACQVRESPVPFTLENVTQLLASSLRSQEGDMKQILADLRSCKSKPP